MSIGIHKSAAATVQTPSTQPDTSPSQTAKSESSQASGTADAYQSTNGNQKEAVSKLCLPGQSANRTLPSESKALADIKENVMPQILGQMKKDGVETNKAHCDGAAARALARLRESGYEAELIGGKGHVTVRVKTQGKDIIVDPTAAQFFKDGSAIDQKLQKKGFVGTDDQLRGMLRDNIDSMEPSAQKLASQGAKPTVEGMRQEILESAKSTGTPPPSNEERAEFMDNYKSEMANDFATGVYQTDRGISGQLIKQSAEKNCQIVEHQRLNANLRP